MDTTLDEVNILEAFSFENKLSFIATGRKVAEKKNVFVFWQFIATCTQFFDWNTIVVVALKWVLGEFGIATKVNEEGFVIVETFNSFPKVHGMCTTI